MMSFLREKQVRQIRPARPSVRAQFNGPTGWIGRCRWGQAVGLRLGLCTLVLIASAVLLGRGSVASGQQVLEPKPNKDDILPIPPDATEDYLIARIGRLRRWQYAQGGPDSAEQQMTKNVFVIESVDMLMARFPESKNKDEALTAKLESLAELARFREEYLAQLLKVTSEIAKSNASPELASENAYFAAEAFVLAARNENMPDEKRFAGQIERYAAFVEDFPQSKRRPIVWASLIRNLLAVKSVERAQVERQKLAEAYPNHIATRRATGEVYRATATGKPFSISFASTDGRTIQSKEYLGKVLVVHFWAGWRKPAMDDMEKLAALHDKYGASDLQLIGVNVDKTQERFNKALQARPLSWPQYFDGKGLESDAVVAVGVIGIPTYLIVDRDGILRAIADEANFVEEIEKWLAVPSTSAPNAGGSKKPETDKVPNPSIEKPSKP